MSQGYISAALRQLVKERANARCEYCLVREGEVLLPHQPDHIIAEQHGGESIDVQKKNLDLEKETNEIWKLVRNT